MAFVLRPILRQTLLVSQRQCRNTFTTYMSSRQRVFLIGAGAFLTTAIGNTMYQTWKTERDRKAMLSGQLYFDSDKREVLQQKSCIDATPVPVEKVLSQRVSRQVPGPTVIPGIKLTLFQYQTCPFCCKVRAFLDYYGLNYDVVEVDPVLRQQIKWSKYRKVPILVITKEPGSKDDSFVDEAVQLNDSTLIISLLMSYFTCNPGLQDNLTQLATLYPSIILANFEENKNVTEVVNKYFLMKGDHMSPDEYKKVIKGLSEERKWREWADNVLVHTLSPNIYRTIDEAIFSFKAFSNVGEWDKQFPTWERLFVIYVGAIAMYFISKRLKKKYHLKDDVRESLFDAIREWEKALGKNKFFGGRTPNLADLAVFGVLSSIDGTDAFAECMMRTKLRKWYVNTKAACAERKGHYRVIAPILEEARKAKQSQ